MRDCRPQEGDYNLERGEGTVAAPGRSRTDGRATVTSLDTFYGSQVLPPVSQPSST